MKNRSSPVSVIHSLFIANRGEIACRVIRSCKERGIRTVVGYSEEDAKALFVRDADVALPYNPELEQIPYLNAKAIIEMASTLQVDALHPGYGFLSENADFAQAVRKAKIEFIGPAAESMRLLGDKLQAKKLAESLSIPLSPSFRYTGSLAEAQRWATKSGYPLLIKAAAGGGGRGMRLIESAATLKELLPRAAAEAKRFFADDTIYLEKKIAPARHIEIQVVADKYGTVATISDRDCSLQRHHQKIIEEAPAPNLSSKLRRALHQAARDLASKAKYYGLGTVEFLIDSNDNFYFLEVNCRLQVEHPVTEMLCGLDLVSLQIDIAENRPLSQRVISLPTEFDQHAIEARICAEQPEQNFSASAGQLQQFSFPHDSNARLDSGFEKGNTVGTSYDSLLAKLIVKGESREDARKLLILLLERSSILGLYTNIAYLQRLLKDSEFIHTRHHITRAEEKALCHGDESLRELIHVAAAFILFTIVDNSMTLPNASVDPWDAREESDTGRGTHDFSIDGTMRSYFCSLNTKQQTITLTLIAEDSSITAQSLSFDVISSADNATIQLSCIYQSICYTINSIFTQRNRLWIGSSLGSSFISRGERTLNKGHKLSAGAATIHAPLPGTVASLKVTVGTIVRSGDTLLILESMKMEHPLISPAAGKIIAVHVSEGSRVEARAALLEIQYD